jgi:proton-translocating NADH-quinone oxidoreductase chain N
MTVGELADWAALAPALSFAGAAMVLFALDMIDPDSENSVMLVAVSALGAITSLTFTGWFLLAGTGQADSNGPIELFDANLVVDGLGLFFAAIIGSVVLLVVLASYEYLEDHPHQSAYYSLVLLAATGMTMVGFANSFVTAFISIELVSLPAYALVGSLKTNRGSAEAGLKYFLIGALSSAIFAYGISLIYASTGALQFDDVVTALESGAANGVEGILGLGVLMVLGGVAFKIAAVPFHFWAPDAYEGAPAPISAFISSASKAAGFVLGIRIFVEVFGNSTVTDTIEWVVAFQILAVVTMTIANFAALKQDRVKRILAYSSVAHAGYVMIALAALTGGFDGGGDINHSLVLGAGLAHLLVYGFMNTGAFLFVALAEYWDVGREVEDYHGLATQAPFACVAMTVFLFSLAGLPPGGGFFSKFYLLWAAIEGEVGLLAAALVINSVVALFYYARIVRALWFEEPATDLEITDHPTGLYAAIAVAMLVTILLLPGLPIVIEFAEAAAEVIGL